MARTPTHRQVMAGMKRIHAARVHYADYMRGVESGLLTKPAIIEARKRLVAGVRKQLDAVPWLREDAEGDE